MINKFISKSFDNFQKKKNFFLQFYQMILFLIFLYNLILEYDKIQKLLVSVLTQLKNFSNYLLIIIIKLLFEIFNASLYLQIPVFLIKKKSKNQFIT